MSTISIENISGSSVAGIDEVGRGPLAGPVTAACVFLPEGFSHPHITDSKKLTERRRELLYEVITEAALAYSIISVGPRRIEQLNIREASRLAMRLAAERAVYALTKASPASFRGRLLIDGNTPIETSFRQETIVKGDQKVSIIAAASILAKVSRDRLMQTLDQRYPNYGLGKHKGYPTATHRASIAEYGPSRIHRRTFAGVREYVQ